MHGATPDRAGLGVTVAKQPGMEPAGQRPQQGGEKFTVVVPRHRPKRAMVSFIFATGFVVAVGSYATVTDRENWIILSLLVLGAAGFAALGWMFMLRPGRKR